MDTSNTSPTNPWYAKGLRFSCTGCGQCCTGGPGVVWITPEEIQKIAALLGISMEECSERFVRKLGGRLALKERSNYDCVFLKEKRCTVYQERPIQCRTFPWWKENLESEEAWREAAKHCEGIREEAPLITLGEIEGQLKRNGF